MKSSWHACLKIVAAVDKGQMVQAALAGVKSNKENISFCTDLVYGVLRSRIHIRQLLSTKLQQLDKLPYAMRVALEIAVYSMLYQNGVPSYAVINETVKLIKSKFGQRLGNVGNAVLRSLVNQDLREPLNCEPMEKWAQFFAVPADIASLWQRAYGRDTAILLMKRSFKRPYAALRVNLRHKNGMRLMRDLADQGNGHVLGRAAVAFKPGQIPDCILGHEPAYWQKCGALSWQAAASQLILEKLNIYEAWRHVPIWDACAGFGGKTLAMLENGLHISLATDKSMLRMQNLPRECKRLGLNLPMVLVADAAMPPLTKWHGNILIDAPCSGLGVLARRPDIKGRFNLRHLAGTVVLQQCLLMKAAKLLTPGSELAYVTCTLNPDENEKQVETLLRENGNMELISQWQTPHDHQWLEGMFGSRLRKKE